MSFNFLSFIFSGFSSWRTHKFSQINCLTNTILYRAGVSAKIFETETRYWRQETETRPRLWAKSRDETETCVSEWL